VQEKKIKNHLGFVNVLSAGLKKFMSQHEDPWNIGTLHKPGIWAFYILSNYIGVMFCLVLIYSVYTNAKRITSDLYIASLASGCIMMSITCGTQCMLSVIDNRFFGGDVACQFEAIAHVSSILVQFFSVTCMTITFYQSVVKKRTFSDKRILQSIAVIWITCLVITGLASLVSPIYLMSAGTYCFFGFSSFAIAGWLVPGLIVALVTMSICHVMVMRYFTSILIQTMHADTSIVHQLGRQKNPILTTEQDIWREQWKWRSTRFILILLCGWGFAAITAVDELVAGRAPEWLVTAVGTGGVSFSWAVPVVHAFSCEHHRKLMIRMFGWVFIPIKGVEWYKTETLTLKTAATKQQPKISIDHTPSLTRSAPSKTTSGLSLPQMELVQQADDEKVESNSQEKMIPAARPSLEEHSVSLKSVTS